MKISIEMENLAKVIEGAMEESIEDVVSDYVKNTVKSHIENTYKGIIEEITRNKMEEYVNDYVKNATIKVHGGTWGDEEIGSFTVEQYIKKEISGIMESKKLKIKSNDRYEKFKEVTFEEYITNSFDAEVLIKNELSGFVDDTRKQINNKVQEAFTDVTKNMLSDTVFNVLMQNDTFVKINENIKCIADKEK